MIKEINIVGERRSGRTSSLISITLGLALEMPGSKILFLSHSYTEAMTAIAKMSNKLSLFSEVNRANKNVIELSNGSKIASITFDNNGKGHAVDCVVVDGIDLMDSETKDKVYVLLQDAKSLITSSEKPLKLLVD